MDNSFITSTFSLRTRGSLPFSFNDCTYYSSEIFSRYPCAYSSHSLSRSYCTCLSSSLYKFPSSPSCNHNLCGSRQSILIQWIPRKKLIFGGLDRYYNAWVPVCDVDRRCYCDKVIRTRNKSVAGRREGLRKWMVYEESSERCSFGGVEEAEVLLSLLTEDIDEECFDVREENRRLIKKIVVEKKGNGETSNRCKNKMKRVDSGVSKGESKVEHETVVFTARERDKKSEERIRREEERKALLRKQNMLARKKIEEEVLLRKERGNARAKEEDRDTSLRKENLKVSVREEERDDLFRREEHRQRLRKDGSSCSSYYSFSSTGEYNSDDEIVGQGEDLWGKSSSVNEKDSTRSDKIVSKDVGMEMQSRINHEEGYGVGLRKKHTEMGLYSGSSGIESDFKKKSEKKLADVLIEETDSRKGSLQKNSSHLEVHESGYGKNSGSYKMYNEMEVKSTSGLKSDEARRQQQRQTTDEALRHSETRIKHKQFTETPEDCGNEVVASYGSQKLYSDRDEKSAKVTSLSSETRREYKSKVGTREDEYSRNTRKVAEVSKFQEIDARKTSISQLLSETRMKKEVGYSTNVVSTDYDALKKQQSNQVTRQVDERGNTQRLTKKGSSSISEMQLDNRIVKQEENTNLTYGLYTESEEQHLQTCAENFGRMDVRIGKKQMTKESGTHSGGAVGVKDENKTRSETLVTPASSQLAARGELDVQSTSGLRIEEVTDGGSESGSTALHKHVLERSPALHYENDGEAESSESHDQPSKFISSDDAIGSAEQLQKSSMHYVDEFVDKARHQISNSGIQKEKKIYESKSVDEEHINRKGSSEYVAQESELKERHSRHSSRGSKTKGPSDETWEIDEPSLQEHSTTEVKDDTSKNENAIVRRTGRSLWTIIGGIIHLKWSTRSESQSTGAKVSGVSPNQSTSSEAWFSGHEAEEDGVSGRKEKSMTSAPVPVHQKQEKTSTESKEVSSSTSVVRHRAADIVSPSNILDSGSASMTISLPSSAETSKRKYEGSSSGASFSESVIPIRLQRSPHVKETCEPIEAGSPGGDTSAQPVSTDLPEKSRQQVNEKLKQRKLKRIDQIPKNKLDEWEEAYRLEAEQRKIDEMFMREALLEAKKAADNWEVPVGAVLVQGGKIIARGCNLVEELRDSTAHAEMICIREASNILRTWRLSETTLYVTLEPCPMCAGAILQARIDTVVWGAPNKLLGADGSWIRLFPSGDGGNGLEQTDKPPAPVHPFHPQITIRQGILASDCAEAMQQFFQLRRKTKEKKSDNPTPTSCLPISNRPSKFLTKMHDAFNIMFCL